MSATNETHPIDELIRAVRPVPAADATEEAAVDAARDRLRAAMSADAPTPARRGRRRRGWRIPAGTVSIAVSCGLVLLVAGVALIALGGRGRSASHATLPGPGANALIAKLAVLRREQTAADQLPAKLHITTFPRDESPTIIPSLSRLVATPPGAKIYLVVTQPARGSDALWSPSLGDQLNVVAITDSGAITEGGAGFPAAAGYPAADITDPMNLFIAGLKLSNSGRTSAAQRLADAYRVAILPDGVARVRWTLTTRTGGAGAVVTVPVMNNVAISKLTPANAAPLRTTTWYAADGHIVPPSSAARTRALASENASRRRTALAAARRSHVTATPAILNAFAVFAFDSRSSTHTLNGYVISHPTLAQLPLSLLPGGLGRRQQLDLRDVRKVVSPSGQTLYIVPGVNTICLFVVYGHSSGGGSGGGCAGSLALALKGGAGESSSGNRMQGSMVYAVVPRTTHDYKLRTGIHAFRIIHPVDGVVIAHTPFSFG
jgi:hypothetical protein